MNKRLNKFSFYSVNILERKDKKSFKRHIYCFSFFSVFLDLISILFSCFNFPSILYRFNDLLYRLIDIISRLNEIFFVLISVLISLFQFLF